MQLAEPFAKKKFWGFIKTICCFCCKKVIFFYLKKYLFVKYDVIKKKYLEIRLRRLRCEEKLIISLINFIDLLYKLY